MRVGDQLTVDSVLRKIRSEVRRKCLECHDALKEHGDASHQFMYSKGAYEALSAILAALDPTFDMEDPFDGITT